MIELKGITKVYGEGENAVHALTDINLTIEDGKFFSIIGKSGSGKSTMMNMIGALDKPTSGDITANGVALKTLSDNKLSEYRNKHIGYVFQAFYLEPTFSVLENVAMPLTIAGVDKQKRESAARKAINLLGLEDKTAKLASELSGGQKQRVSIARAIVHEPKIILADEPTGNLDSQNGYEVIKLLQKVADTGKTVVLVTHNIEDARKTDVMVELKDGKIEHITHNNAADKAAAQKAHDYDEKGRLKHNAASPSAARPVSSSAQAADQPPLSDVERESWEPPVGSPPFLTGFAYKKDGQAHYIDDSGIDRVIEEYDEKINLITLYNGHKYKLR